MLRRKKKIAAGGALLTAPFEKLFNKLVSPEVRQLASKKKVRSQLHKWEKDLLPKIHAVLEDAEEKQTTSRLVYDVEDVLDEFSTEALRLNLKKRRQAAASTSRDKVKGLSFFFHMSLG